MVAHILLHIAQAQFFFRLYPQRQVVAFIELTIDIGQILVHFVAVVPEETPHAGVGVAHVFEIYGAIGIAEREILVLSVEKALFACQRDNVVGIDTFHFRIVYIFEALAADGSSLSAFSFPFF